VCVCVCVCVCACEQVEIGLKAHNDCDVIRCLTEAPVSSPSLSFTSASSFPIVTVKKIRAEIELRISNMSVEDEQYTGESMADK